MSLSDAAEPVRDGDARPDVTALIPIVRRIVFSRVNDGTVAEDLVQETLARVLSAAERVEPRMLEPYAIVTARNVIASMRRNQDRHRRNEHRVVDLTSAEAPEDNLLRMEERNAVATALQRLSTGERRTLLAHEVTGQGTQSLGSELGLTAGAVAARLSRSRARLRVEYLLALRDSEPPSDGCRPVLLAVSSADRRRQRELDAARHLLECDFCATLSEPLLQRGQRRDEEAHVPIRHDPDIVEARKSARALASRLGFGPTDLTLIATQSPRLPATSCGSPVGARCILSC